MFTSRSRKFVHPLAPHVTLQPIGWFSRSLKVAIDLRACVMIAF